MTLQEQLSKQPWFHSTGTDQFGRHVVYVKQLSLDVYQAIPDQFDGKQVIIAYAAYQQAKPNTIGNVPEPETIADEEPEEIDPVKEIWALKRICGASNLKKMLEELYDMPDLHDKFRGAVSRDFPEVCDKLIELYDEFGYDVLYDEITHA